MIKLKKETYKNNNYKVGYNRCLRAKRQHTPHNSQVLCGAQSEGMRMLYYITYIELGQPK